LTEVFFDVSLTVRFAVVSKTRSLTGVFFVNLFSYRYSIRSPEKRERIDRRRLSPKSLGDKGSRVKNPRGSRHCVPAICVAFIQ